MNKNRQRVFCLETYSMLLIFVLPQANLKQTHIYHFLNGSPTWFWLPKKVRSAVHINCMYFEGTQLTRNGT